ncbi:16S rRNA (guanine(527)-N(7))-methyltransferase RsmG [Granulicella sp. L60]|uniref:16S rRNA (guanine(527)-N(7))-methyltransferase RsmG n=1 Tax=Granulicella sp. L60 TaxID=1641866 RepID=UPI00131D40A4|nr:16S rRNA (guanine(527)-N(7))-methyltransferase RsmG [Granulicella sp. L60]
MATLSESVITGLLAPYLDANPAPKPVNPDLYTKLSLYLDLLLKWNARTNLTAIREPQEIVRRHFGESLFAGLHLDACPTLLDFGSGAGFPGLPIAILRPDIAVTVAESQNKKSTFLREVVRTLGLQVNVWTSRVEDMSPTRQFDTVALRAVDNMTAALTAAHPRAKHHLLLLTGAIPELPQGFEPPRSMPIPNSENSFLLISTRSK